MRNAKTRQHDRQDGFPLFKSSKLSKALVAKTPFVFNLRSRTDNKALFQDLKLFPQVGG